MYRFQDNDQRAPYSIHQIAEEGAKLGRLPGDWYGPQAISIVLKKLSNKYNPISNFRMVVAKEGNVFLDRIEAKSKNWSNSIFLVVPLRLGLNKIEPEYLQSIRDVFRVFDE